MPGGILNSKSRGTGTKYNFCVQVGAKFVINGAFGVKLRSERLTQIFILNLVYTRIQDAANCSCNNQVAHFDYVSMDYAYTVIICLFCVAIMIEDISGTLTGKHDLFFRRFSKKLLILIQKNWCICLFVYLFMYASCRCGAGRNFDAKIVKLKWYILWPCKMGEFEDGTC